jgi:hypothetical protein
VTLLQELINLGGIFAKFLWGISPEDPWVAVFDLDRKRNASSLFSSGLLMGVG